MPLYRFHICDGEGFCEDLEGIELVDREAAYAEALRGARSLMVEEVIEGRLSLASFIEVEDQNGELLFTVTFEEALEFDPRPVAGHKPRS